MKAANQAIHFLTMNKTPLIKKIEHRQIEFKLAKQTALDEFVFEVVSDEELSEDILLNIQLKAELYLESGLKIKIVRKQFIERPESGKIKHFYSFIN